MLRSRPPRRAQQALADGDQQLARGEPAAAERSFGEALARLTDGTGGAARSEAPTGAGAGHAELLAAAHLGLGRARLAAADPSAARDHFRAVREAVPHDWRGWHWSGCAAAQLGDDDAADSHFTTALAQPLAQHLSPSQSPSPSRTLRQRARVRARQGRTRAALDDLAAAAREQSPDMSDRWLLAVLLLRAGDWKQAEQALRPLLDPGSPRAATARGMLGYALERQGEPHAALAAYEQARRDGNASDSLLLRHGLLAYRLGRYTDSVRSLTDFRERTDLREGRDRPPREQPVDAGRTALLARATYGAAVPLLRRKDYAGALRQLTRSEPHWPPGALDHTIVELRLYAAWRAFTSGNGAAGRERARTHLADAERRRPHDPRVLHCLALLAYGGGAHREAVALWTRALRQRPDDPRVRCALALCRARAGDEAAAEAELTELAEAEGSPVPPRAALALAALRVRAGRRWASAAEALTRQPPPVPADPLREALLAECHYRSGQPSSGHWQTAAHCRDGHPQAALNSLRTAAPTAPGPPTARATHEAARQLRRAALARMGPAAAQAPGSAAPARAPAPAEGADAASSPDRAVASGQAPGRSSSGAPDQAPAPAAAPAPGPGRAPVPAADQSALVAALFEHSLRLVPESPREGGGVVFEAAVLVRGGRRDVALRLLGEAARRDPGDHRCAHALAVLLLNTLAGSGAAATGGPPPVEARWEQCLALWAVVLHHDGFWRDFRQRSADRCGQPVGDELVESLRTGLREHLEALAPTGAPGVHPRLLWQRETEGARLLGAAGGLPLPPAVGGGRLVCGPLRIAELGLQAEFGAFAAARGDPADLRLWFSQLGVAKAQLSGGAVRDALRSLADLRCPRCRTVRPAQRRIRAGDRPARPLRCPPGCAGFDLVNPAYAGRPGKERDLSDDAVAMARDALFTLGCSSLTSGEPDLAEAAASWRGALARAAALGTSGETRRAIEETALGRAETLHRADDIGGATAVLDLAYGLLDDTGRERLRGRLAALLTDRGIRAANAHPQALEPPADDLRRAVELNPHHLRAQTNLGVVLRMLAAHRIRAGRAGDGVALLHETSDRLGSALEHHVDNQELEEMRRDVLADLHRLL